MEPLRTLTSPGLALPIPNIDTDQIVPARFLTGLQRVGLQAALFADLRRDARGELRPDFPLNRPEASGARILLAGDNFGCGSSREHAPWALLESGFRAVLSTRIADIFAGNALKNGLLALTISPTLYAVLLRAPRAPISIDLETCWVGQQGRGGERFDLDPFVRYRLMRGLDELDYLLAQRPALLAYEARHR